MHETPLSRFQKFVDGQPDIELWLRRQQGEFFAMLKYREHTVPFKQDERSSYIGSASGDGNVFPDRAIVELALKVQSGVLLLPYSREEDGYPSDWTRAIQVPSFYV